MAILRCTESHFDGTRVVAAGELVDSDDPILQGREQYFEPVDTYVTRRSARAVETATAAPGEVRTVKRPRKS